MGGAEARLLAGVGAQVMGVGVIALLGDDLLHHVAISLLVVDGATTCRLLTTAAVETRLLDTVHHHIDIVHHHIDRVHQGIDVVDDANRCRGRRLNICYFSVAFQFSGFGLHLSSSACPVWFAFTLKTAKT